MVLVAPGMSLKLAPPSVLTCHCTVGVGLPLAAAVKVAVWPAVTVWLAGWAVIEGANWAVVTVRVAALVVAVPTLLVNTAWYSSPFWAVVVLLRVRVVLVAPGMSLKVEPPSVLTCHCTVGVGLPLAAAVKVAVWPAVTVWLAGWAVIEGANWAVVTVRVAALVVAVPTLLVNTAWYSSPFWAVVVLLRVRVVLVAPGMSLKVEPPSVLTCHCTVGVGLPLAAAVKVAVWPAVTVWLVGWAVIEGATWAVVTVRVAAVVVAVPTLLVKTAWYSSPFWAVVVLLRVRVVLVRPGCR